MEKPKTVSSIEKSTLREIIHSETKGAHQVEVDKRFSDERKTLYKNKTHKEELRKFLYGGNPSEEYLSKLFNIYKKYDKTSAETLEEFKIQNNIKG
jgi:hypothetical protein